MDNNIVTFLDSMQRTVFGEKISEDETTITIREPVVVNISPYRDPKSGKEGTVLQLVPIFFSEFKADLSDYMDYVYNKSTITMGKGLIGGFDCKLPANLENIRRAAKMQQQNTQLASNKNDTTPVIDLFDDGSK